MQTLISIADAQDHLRDTRPEVSEELTRKLGAAVLMAERFMNRKIYPTAAALAEARAVIHIDLGAAYDVYDDAMATADLSLDSRIRTDLYASANQALTEARTTARRVQVGVEVDEMIRAGILLILGHLWENRQDVQTVVGATSAQEIPMSSAHVLQPYRIDVGV